MDNKFKNVLTLGGFIIFAIFIAFLLPKEEEANILQDTALEQGDFYEDNQNDSIIYVYVLGAVHEPGVIKAPLDSRVYEVLALAGGTTEKADLEKLNLASIVKDAQKIVVPYLIEISGDINSEKSYSVEALSHKGLININTANQNELETLEGIGSNTAKKIIKYREEIGYFNSVDELMNVNGIGENKYNEIKDDITV